VLVCILIVVDVASRSASVVLLHISGTLPRVVGGRWSHRLRPPGALSPSRDRSFINRAAPSEIRRVWDRTKTSFYAIVLVQKLSAASCGCPSHGRCRWPTAADNIKTTDDRRIRCLCRTSLMTSWHPHLRGSYTV